MVTEGFSALTPAMLDEVIRRADGVPLFAEEVARVLIDASSPGASGRLSGSGQLRIPGTLRDLLTARLDRLGSGVRRTAQLAAVFGREFRYDMLSAVAEKEDAALRADLRELTGAGL